jgi:hypothetical protein
VIRGFAESLLWFSGTGRLLPNWQAVEKQIHAAFANSDVLEAADIESVKRVPGYRNRYEVKPTNGPSFGVTVRAATLDNGHPGEFVAPKDGSYPATLTVSNRANDNAVTRTVANLLHQLAHAGRTGPDVLRPGAEAKLNTTLSRADGGRLAEARLLERQLGKTPVYRLVRRQDRRNDILALMEHLGVASGQKDAAWRQSLPELQRLRPKPGNAADTDGRMLDRMTKGWAAGDDRPRTRVYVARELIAAGIPATAGTVGLAITENLAYALGYGVPLVAAAAVTGLVQRWLDGHKNAVKAEKGLAHQKEAAKRNPGILNQLESDPYGVAGTPVEELDASTMTPTSLLYRLRHVAPGVVAVGLSTVLTGAVNPAIAVYYAASAVIKPITEKFADGRKNKLKVLRREEWIARVAADPLRYQNELADFLEQLGQRLNQATGALSRTAGEPGSVGYRTLRQTELTDQLPEAIRRLVPRAPNAKEADPTALSTYLNSYGEILTVGALNGLVSALASARVIAYVDRKSDQASDAAYRFNLDLVEHAEARALLDGVHADVTRLVELVNLVETLAAQAHNPAKAKLLSRTLDRFRQTKPRTNPPTKPLVTAVPEGPAPAAAPDPDQEPQNIPSYRVQALFTIPPALTVAGINIADVVVGLDPTWFTAIVFTATAAIFAAPLARWLGLPQESKHVRHAADADNMRAANQQRAADHVGVVMFLMQLRESELLAHAQSLQPDAGPARSNAFSLFRAVDLLLRGHERAADFTDRVRAAVRAARLTIDPSGSHSARTYRHSALDKIEHHADRVDEAADAVRRKVPGARTVLRKARQELVAAMQAHAAKFTDGRGSLPDLGTVDPATGTRVTGDPLTRARAAAAESWRRMLAESGSTALLAQRVIALTRVRNALEVLARELAFGDNERVKLANNELNQYADEFRELQRQAGVAGDPRIVTAALQLQVKEFLGRRPPDGNAAKLEEFVANGPVQDHAELTRRVIRALTAGGLAHHTGVDSIVPVGDGTVVEVTLNDGRRIVLRFAVGPVADSHPAEYTLTDGTEYAVVRISDRIKPDDLQRAVVHEIRELSRRFAGDDVTVAHEQGRVGELLYLDEELQVAEYYEGPDLDRRRRYQDKMREVYDDLLLNDADRRDQLDPALADLIARNELDGIWVSEERAIHIGSLHGHGTGSKGTKFHPDFPLDPDSLQALADEVLALSPVPVGRDPLTGNYQYEYDFGASRIIGDGTGRIVVWISPTGTVRTMHPEERKHWNR